MAQSNGKTLVLWLLATLLIALLGGAQAVIFCNVDSSQLNSCRAAITGQNPPPPDEKCCAVIRRANLPCLCGYKSLLPVIGINPKNALALPDSNGLLHNISPSVLVEANDSKLSINLTISGLSNRK
ncbi:putative lipid-transfer protein DIR1, partial [Mucuna pruriens]